MRFGSRRECGVEWLGRLGVTTLYIELGSPWENVYIASFNARSRDELLNGEIFYSLEELRIFILLPDPLSRDYRMSSGRLLYGCYPNPVDQPLVSRETTGRPPEFAPAEPWESVRFAGPPKEQPPRNLSG